MSNKTKHDQKKLMLILLLVLISGIGLAIAYPIFPPLFIHPDINGIISNQISPVHRGLLLGLTLAAFPVGVFFGAPILGGLADRYGKGKIILLSLALAAIGHTLCGLSVKHHALALLIFSRFFTGFVESVIAIARSMASDIKHLPRAKTIGLVNSAACISYIIGPLLGGLLSNNHISPWFNDSFPFYVGAGLCLLTALLALPVFLNSPQTNNAQQVALSKKNSLNFITQLKSYATTPTILRYLIASTLFTFGVDIYYNLFPVLLTLKWHFVAWQISLFLSLSTIALALSCTVIVDLYITLNIGIAKSIIIGIIICSTTLTLAAFYQSIWLTLLNVIILSLTLGTVTTQLTAELSRCGDPTNQGSIMGSQMGLRMLGDAVLCMVGGLIIVAHIALPFVIGGIAMLLSLLVFVHQLKSYSTTAA